MSFSHIISPFYYFTSEPPTCMQCMLGRLCDCTGVLVALGGWPLLHSSSFSYLFRSLPSCTYEHVMLDCTDICCISQLFCMLCCHFPHIFCLQYFIRLSSTWLKQKQISIFAYFIAHHCSAVSCCLLNHMFVLLILAIVLSLICLIKFATLLVSVNCSVILTLFIYCYGI